MSGLSEQEREALIALASTLHHDRMALYGYSDAEIEKANAIPDHDALGCGWTGYGWDCTSADGRSNHPAYDDSEKTAEFVMWLLEHPAMLAARPERARPDRSAVAIARAAWNEGWMAAWTPMSPCGLDDGPNPYRADALEVQQP